MPREGRVMTQCNAGALATGGIGTALGVIRVAVEQGHKLHVLVPETRPYLQGARLTAWELHRGGIPLTLITDNMVGHFLKTGNIGAVVTGADRIAANGDSANKIGTYQIAVLAKENNVPFYIAAPVSTFDLTIPDGDHITIEERAASEVTHMQGRKHRARRSCRAPRLRRHASPLHQCDLHRTRHCARSVHRITALSSQLRWARGRSIRRLRAAAAFDRSMSNAIRTSIRVAAIVLTLLMPVARASAQADKTPPIRLHPANPHYFLFRGKVVALVTSGEHYGAVLNADFDYHRYLRTLEAAGLNYTRLFGGSYLEVPGKSFGILRNDLAPLPGRFIAPWARSGTPGYAGGGNKFDLGAVEHRILHALSRFSVRSCETGNCRGVDAVLIQLR